MRMRRLGGIGILLAVCLSLSGGSAHADGCEDMKQLCKEATAKATKCTKDSKDERACKAVIDVRDTTCTQVDLVCKPAVGEPG
jgi:hypothetical protein